MPRNVSRDKFATGIVDLLIRIEKDHQEMIRREAIGWTVVCVDTDVEEGWEVAHTSGVHESLELALAAAAAFDAEDGRLGVMGWKHIVSPIFPK